MVQELRYFKNYIFLFIKISLTAELEFLLQPLNIILKFSYLQGYAKLINILKHQKEFRFLYREIVDMYEMYEKKNISYKICLKNNLSLVKKLLTCILGIVIIVSIGVIVVPLYLWMILNQRIDILPFDLPFIDKTTEYGYICTFVGHIICVFLGAFGNFVVDSWLFIYAAHVPLMKNLMQCKFDELSGIVDENPKCIEKSKLLLIDIFKWHQKYIQ